MKFLKALFFIFLILIVSYIVISFSIKKTFLLETKIVINRPDSIVYRYFIDLNHFKVWNAWTGKGVKDVNKNVFGKGNQPGDVYTWKGENTGEGELRNLEMTPNFFLKQRLTFKRPSRTPQLSDMYFKPLDDNTRTEVIWRYYGTNESTLDGLFQFFYAKKIEKYLDKGLLVVKNELEK